MPGSQTGVPMTYVHQNRQFILVAVNGQPAGQLVAFALPAPAGAGGRGGRAGGGGAPQAPAPAAPAAPGAPGAAVRSSNRAACVRAIECWGLYRRQPPTV